MGKRKTHEEFVQEFNKKYNGKFSIVGTYIDCSTPIKIKCNSCKIDFFRIPSNVIRRNCCCPICDTKLVTNSITVGVNDLWTTRPDVASMLKNTDDGYNVKEKSNKKLPFICPHCKNELYKTVSFVSSSGLSCNYCGDTYSYPNRFMTNLLNILNVDFVNEFMIEPYKYKYDFMFVHNSKKYLVEMDGAYGHGERDNNHNTKEEQIAIDNKKDLIAQNNNYEMIRIDCKYKNDNDKFDYICKKIIESKLYKLLDINYDNLLNANELSQDSILIQISNDWNNGITDYEHYYSKYHYKRQSIRRKLVQCSKLNLIKDSPKKIYEITKDNAGKKISITKGQPVICNETGEVYQSISYASKQTGFNVSNYFNPKRNDAYAGELPDGTKLTWTKITKEQYENIKSRAS